MNKYYEKQGYKPNEVPNEYSYADGTGYWATIEDEEYGAEVLAAILKDDGYRTYKNFVNWLKACT